MEPISRFLHRPVPIERHFSRKLPFGKLHACPGSYQLDHSFDLMNYLCENDFEVGIFTGSIVLSQTWCDSCFSHYESGGAMGNRTSHSTSLYFHLLWVLALRLISHRSHQITFRGYPYYTTPFHLYTFEYLYWGRLSPVFRYTSGVSRVQACLRSHKEVGGHAINRDGGWV